MRLCLFITILLLWIGIVQGQTTKTVGSTGANYTTLKAAFDAINSGAIKGQIILQITESTTETASAVLYSSGTGSSSYTSVVIYPTITGKTIGGNVTVPMIELNGADNVTIDGRLNQSGLKDLTILNSNTGTTAGTIRMINSAENNTIKYCTIKGSPSGASMAIIQFSTSATGNGNDNNTIDHNDITNSTDANRPLNAIYSAGSSSHENSTCTISNNNIYDVLSAAVSSRGINIASNSNDWTISGNSFYETKTMVPTGGYTYQVIYIGTTTSHVVNGNYIGGSAAQCAGSAMTIGSSFAHYFAGMYVSGGTSTPVTLQNNTIKNINYTSTNSNPWDGIYLVTGATNVNVLGNTIGATTGTGSIVVTTPNASATATITGGAVTGITLVGGGSGFTTAPILTFSTSGSTTAATATASIDVNGVVIKDGFTITSGGVGYTSAPSVNFNGATYSTSHGIRHLSTGTVTISNNNIGSVTTIGNDFYSHCFEAIVISGTAPTITINNNLIGSLTEDRSIQTGSTSGSSLIKQDVRGIYINSSVPVATITGNTIANMYSAYTGNSASKFDGICTSGGSNTIQNNTIRNLSTIGNSNVIVKGIQQTVTASNTNQTVSGNTVYNLSNTNGSASCRIIGIDFASATSGTNILSGNFVHSLSLSSSAITSEIDGIVLGGGLATTANNIVNIGGGLTTGYKIYGIYDNSSASNVNNNNVYFNSVYVGGSVSTVTTSPTGALWNSNNLCIRNYRNNILVNARTGGSTGKHYAIRLPGTNGLTIDYNDYFVSGSPSFSGYLGGSGDKITLDSWKTATGQETNSLNMDPVFASAGGTDAINYSISSILNGLTGTGITTDYAGLTRPIIPKMGALETSSYVWHGSTSTDYNTISNWTPAEVPPAGADIAFAASPTNHCILDQNRTVGTITNAQSTYKLITNSHQLTINKNLIFSNDAKIDASSGSSTVVFAGTSAQSIPTGAFVSNTIDDLTLNNSNGLTFSDNLIVSQILTLTSGALAIGANTLTLNGAISKTSGSLTGGASSNLAFGGTTSTTLPSITLNNLSINRSDGITLGGDVTVGGTLALNSGTLTVGANTLTISGSSPTSVSGSVDASNSSANLVFANASAITLPSTFFASPVNNLTLTASGGVTAGSDITVNGILNLAAANPSATKGLLEMTIDYTGYPGTSKSSYLNSYLLNMGATAITTGTGDVTGTVKRATIVANTPYTFGHQYTTVSLTTGNMPTALAVTITIGNSPYNTKKSDDIINDALKRTYEIVPTGGSNCFVTANFHYLESELTSSNSPFNLNSEQKLTTMDYDIEGGATASDEHGRANYDYTNNYIGLSSVPIDYFIQIPVTHAWRTIFALRDYGVDYFTWNGSVSSNWRTADNWTLPYSGVGIPTELSHVIIPDAATTLFDPVLPTGNTTINTISIENGGILAMGDNTLTIQNTLSGGWEDQNPLGNDPGTSTVVFNRKNTTISGNVQFYNVQIFSDGTNVGDITNQTNSAMKIAGSITRTGLGTGKWYADVFGATVEYNGGDQTVLLPDGSPHYHNLTLSGSGTKTMPAVALSLHGNFTVTGSATATSLAAMTIPGNLTVGAGATFNAGAFNHIVDGEIFNEGTITLAAGSAINCGGHFTNNGTFTGNNSSTVTFGGSSVQTIGGTNASTFGNLTSNNTVGTILTNDALTTVSNALTVNSGNKFEIATGKQMTVLASGSVDNKSAVDGLTIRSDATGTGSLIILGSTTASATVERDMSYDSWHLIGVPANQTIWSFLDTNLDIPVLSEPVTPVTFGMTDYKPSTNSWNSYFTQAIVGNTFLGAGKGYMVRTLLNYGLTLKFQGTLNAGTTSPSVAVGWNCIGNPYTSAISINSQAGVSNFINTNSGSLNPSNKGVYFWNGSSYDISNLADDAASYAQSGQGFFIKAIAETVTFNSNMQVHQPVAPFKGATVPYPAIKLLATSNDNRFSTTIKFIEGTTKGLDVGYDAGIFKSDPNFALYTRLVEDNGVDFQLQCLPPTGYEKLIVPVGVDSKAGGEIVFTVQTVELDPKCKVILEDKLNNTFTDLSKAAYKITVAANTSAANRFYLHTGDIISSLEDQPLPGRLAAYAIKNVEIRLIGQVGDNAKATLYDALGRVVLFKTLGAGSLNIIGLPNLKSGLYMLNVTEKGTTQTIKIMIRR